MPIDRRFFLDLARSEARMPIGTHLVLHEHSDAAEITIDPERLAGVIMETARRFSTPVAIPLMDLTLEKEMLLRACGVPDSAIDSFHFTEAPVIPEHVPLTARMLAATGAIEHVARHGDLVPTGMAIGPFSLTTKLVADPITPVYEAGTGETAANHPEIALLEAALAAAEQTVTTYVDAQVNAGARVMLICEPAANRVYFSPNQLADSYATFDRYVMEPMRRLAERLQARGVALIFHDCGELTDGMVERFATLGAAMLSFGSSRKLWEDAARVPKDTVLYGNLPTKRFYSPQLTTEEVERLTTELIERMRATGHPFILGSECDVLSVAGAEQEILSKVNTFMRCGCEPAVGRPRAARTTPG